MIAHKSYEANGRGRDFVVGDLHGCYDLLTARLDEVGFEPARDRLFSVGDLADRGPNSRQCLGLLDEPWFHAALGNHEQMLLDAAAGDFEATHWRFNGGGWALDGDALEPGVEQWAVKILATTALAMTIESTIGPVGICHARPPQSWSAVEGLSETEIEDCLWSREPVPGPVAGVARVYVGHNIVPRIVATHNVVSIDTGAVFSGELTVVEIDVPLA
ncbi:MAG: metallophosphoesterase [Alphaproteobacteria bacterium]|nr:metallophosphoesterase [Alphaproteobacteria bacterium]